ncbi:YybH family protein [Kribbella deserti]|uniref:YybH family protein n=1 Tax=Kribbella deserti TaxID=1926257 RepID=A0ABV6QXM1_9ACTN
MSTEIGASEQDVIAAQTAAVMQHNMDAFSAGDLDAVVADYDDAALVVNDIFGTASGRTEIRALFERLLADVFPPERITVEHTAEIISGRLAFYTWRAENASFGTDTFIVENGRIVLQTFAVQFSHLERNVG